MKIISAQDWELLSFFEVEPEFQDPSEPWPYTDACYHVQQGSISLSVAIAPAYRDVRIILSIDGERVYEFTSMGVEDVRYVKEQGSEMLQIIIDERDSMTLRIKPRITIEQKIQMDE
jgi:hypothetical protein